MKLWASQTAEAVCLFRAAEQRKPAEARVIDDAFAHLFLGPLHGAALRTLERTGRLGTLAEHLTFGLSPFVVARHRFIDDALLAAIESGTLERLVLLGAGYDTRPFRFADALKAAEIEVVEIDHPATGRRRQRILEKHRAWLPPIERRVLSIDFEREQLADRLEAEGLRDDRSTFWVWEGVSMYLSRAAVQRTLQTLHAACGSGSHLCLDLWFLIDDASFGGTVMRTTPGALSLIGEPITFGLHPEDAAPFLSHEGWAVSDLADAEALESRYLEAGRASYRASYVVHALREEREPGAP